QAAESWNGEGSFLYTSSSAPYDCNDNGLCDEDTPVVPIGRSPRTDVLLKAENIVLEFGGKGAHAYYLEKGIVESRPDHILNLIHYEDAASLSVAILKKQFRGKIFLGCDNHPLSRLDGFPYIRLVEIHLLEELASSACVWFYDRHDQNQLCLCQM
ncbi:hypothetical protein A2U01_0013115, partial [Trifolium medium]|nr:hypothetical protein [Trifolium medium]